MMPRTAPSMPTTQYTFEEAIELVVFWHQKQSCVNVLQETPNATQRLTAGPGTAGHARSLGASSLASEARTLILASMVQSPLALQATASRVRTGRQTEAALPPCAPVRSPHRPCPATRSRTTFPLRAPGRVGPTLRHVTRSSRATGPTGPDARNHFDPKRLQLAADIAGTGPNVAIRRTGPVGDPDNMLHHQRGAGKSRRRSHARWRQHPESSRFAIQWRRKWRQ